LLVGVVVSRMCRLPLRITASALQRLSTGMAATWRV
jgi:hypothetical protein